MRILIGLTWCPAYWQTQQKSSKTLTFIVASLKITRVNLASFVSGCTTALYTVEIADHCVEPRASTTVTSGTLVPMLAQPHVASFLVSRYVSAQLISSGNWAASSCTGSSYVTEPTPVATPRQIQFESEASFLSTCNWTSPKSDWAAPVTLTKKGRKFCARHDGMSWCRGNEHIGIDRK